jgi:hypothetical protein
MSEHMTDEEAVARALCLEDGQTWDELDEVGLLRFYSMACVAIAALRSRGWEKRADEPEVEASKPVILCGCGKVLENPSAYASHCQEFPGHFTALASQPGEGE